MLSLKLSLRNILGAGLRTWLNAFVLSIVFVAMIGLNGIIVGMNRSTTNNMKKALYGGGQYWHQNYDPFDPSTIEQSHAQPPEKMEMLMESVVIGFVGSVIGIAIGILGSYYLQEIGIDVSGMMKESTILMSPVLRAQITTEAYFIGFIPGLIANFLGTAVAGIGIFKRDTSQLFRELEM